MNLRSLGWVLAAGLAFSGCVIWPSVDERSPAVSGRVVEANTELPIKGATVMLHEHSSYKAKTDSAGIYHIRARHNVHLLMLLGICGEEIPEGTYYRADELDILHPNYEARRIKAADFYSPSSTNGTSVVLRDVELVPVSKP